jgi:tetratricopeptide (TPR) repeat protein
LLVFLLSLLLFFPSPRAGAIGNDLNNAARLYQQEKFNDALAALDRSEKTSPPSAESFDLRGCILMEQGKFDEAGRAFDSARQLEPNLFASRLHAADLLLRQKKFADARAIYDGLLKETNILTAFERLRFGVLLTWLGEHNDAEAKKVYDAIRFPTETPAYYYAQAAWAFAHGKESEARGWLKQATKLYAADATSWFARWLFEFGWVKEKPPLSTAR